MDTNIKIFHKIGALGQTRTGTPLRARILSPLCLPFHHEGIYTHIYIYTLIGNFGKNKLFYLFSL